MLKFYSYFKQATEGPCKSPKPGFWDVVSRAKWSAWNSLGNMSKEEAMNNYVEELKKIVETMSYTENVATFLSSLNSFYETVPAEDLELVCGSVLERIRSQQNLESDSSKKITETCSNENNKLFYNVNNSVSTSGNGTALYSQENETDEEFADTIEFTTSNFQKQFVEPSTCENSPYLYSTSENSDKIVSDMNGMPINIELQSKINRDQIIYNALNNTDSEFSHAILVSLKSLQNDLDKIIVRLNCIEKQIHSSIQLHSNFIKKQSKNNRWFFDKNTLMLMSIAVLWPFLAQFFIFLLKRRQRCKS
ncbi:acyl-CoA-binding domain-containing protein 5 isoform X2 [Phymastichus coffea]|nr:acyl-CoA-binding domain-containing protein 5 isoform X2 [Phymastichus coffea]